MRIPVPFHRSALCAPNCCSRRSVSRQVMQGHASRVGVVREAKSCVQSQLQHGGVSSRPVCRITLLRQFGVALAEASRDAGCGPAMASMGGVIDDRGRSRRRSEGRRLRCDPWEVLDRGAFPRRLARCGGSTSFRAKKTTPKGGPCRSPSRPKSRRACWTSRPASDAVRPKAPRVPCRRRRMRRAEGADELIQRKETR